MAQTVMKMGNMMVAFTVVAEMNAARSYAIGNHCKTIIIRGNLDGDFQEVFTLPSDGDTSYPGMLTVGDELWMSYYSTDGVPGKASIFLAKIPLKALTK